VDTVGNMGGWITNVIERDTVSPVTPTLAISAPGPKGDQLLAVNVNGESFSNLNLTVFKNNIQIKNLDFTVNAEGKFSSSNLIGTLDCPKVKYKVVAKLTDRAGNISQISESELETLECPSCMGGTKIGWQNPIQDPRVRPTSGYRIPTRPDHDGLDMNVGPGIEGIPIYPARPGKVTYSRYSYTNSSRWTPDPNKPGKYLDTSNYVIVDHGDGYKTHYVHLMYEDANSTNRVTIGQQVSTNTILGRLGNTGQSSGPHLHFGVFFNGIDKDPNIYINATGGDALDWQRPKWCKQSGEGEITENQREWLYDYKTQEPITITFKQKSWPFNGGSLESISGEAKPVITRVIKKTDYILGIDRDPYNGEYKDTYQMFGIAPYQNQKIIIKLKDRNGNIAEIKEENLNTARMQIRKNCINLTDETIKSEADFTNTGGRLEQTLKTRWGSEICTGNNKVTLEDEFWIDSYLKHQTACFNDVCKLEGSVGGNYGTYSDRKKLKDNTEKLLDEGQGIEKRIQVTGGDSDTVGSKMVHDTNNRYIRLKSALGRSLNQYNLGNVWIISHGWDGTLEKTNQLANDIARDNPDDTVLYLDWREVSHTVTPHQSATWTEATSTKIKEALNNWGFSDKNKLRLVGHSMGTILNGEIGLRFGKASYSMSLDNPASYGSKYKVNKHGKDKSGFNQTTQISNAVTGSFSPAGDMEFAETADLPIAMHYNGRQAYQGDWHGFTRDTYIALQNEDKLQNDYLTSSDMSKRNEWSYFGQQGIGRNSGYGYNVKGQLLMTAGNNSDRGETEYLQYKPDFFDGYRYAKQNNIN